MLGATGVCLAYFWHAGSLSLQLASTALLVPAISTILFLCLSIGINDLYATNSLRFPLNLTLPTIFTALLFLSTILLSKVGLSISRIPESFSAIHIWSSPWLLVSTFAAGVVALSLLALFEGKEDGAVDS